MNQDWPIDHRPNTGAGNNQGAPNIVSQTPLQAKGQVQEPTAATLIK